MIYELMMNSALEDNGVVSETKGRKKGLETLVDRLNGRIPYDPKEILEALSFASEQGSLICEEHGSGLKWKWKDFLC